MGKIKTLALRYTKDKYDILKNLKDNSESSNWEDFIFNTIIKENKERD